MQRTNARYIALIVSLAVFAGVAIGGLVSMSKAVDDTRKVVSTLQYNAVRGDCIREITANVDQQFRVDISDLLTVGRSSPAKTQALIARMGIEAKVNYAETVLKKCPPAIQKEKP